MQFSPWGKIFWRRKLPGLVSPKVLESRGRQLRVADRVLDVLVTQVVLDRTRIMAIVGQLVACSMTQHVRVDGEPKPSTASGARDDLPRGRIGERAAAFADEHVRRAR